MELPQPRPFGSEGKKPTHDFLSPYSHSRFQHQDPKPTTTSGIYLKTHDFLRPLERVGKDGRKGENAVENVKTSTVVEKLSPTTTTASVGHVLPGGIGTYSISHISNFPRRVPRPEGIVYGTERIGEVSKANSDCSSYSSGGAFTLWGESVVKDHGAAVKDIAGARHVVTKGPAEKLGPWSSERVTQFPFIHRNSLSSQSFSKPAGQKNQNFMEMMKSASRGPQEEEDDDDEEFVVKNDGSLHKGDLTVKEDGKIATLKPITPRSKHSATEQRRRSKINDRFQILRELIPHSDQKRDKASFLLEVIEYIQFLHEKVHKYEQLYPGWNPEPTKLTPWRSSHGPGESMIDHSRDMKTDPGPGLMFAGKFDENNVAMTPTMLPNAQNVVESDVSTGAAYRPMDHHVGLAEKSIPLSIPMQPNMFGPVGQSGGLAQPPLRPMSDVEDMSAQPQSKLWRNKPCTTTGDTPNELEDLTIEGGTISISSVYSQGLLNSLTQALQHSGVDLAQASISVQIDLGKRAINRLATMTSSVQDHEDPSGNRAMPHYRVGSSGEDSDHAQKRLKTERS
ncbi:transcription factor BIM2-like [Telopea speciosissima]|uniref:transcription factor BIM2-like n=1 Tax=Telopea speciosissima TaxID=54955 RepID=UPI001CC5BD6A|nr:transcription factor BIM2-like [Telopea speciosissima]